MKLHASNLTRIETLRSTNKRRNFRWSGSCDTNLKLTRDLLAIATFLVADKIRHRLRRSYSYSVTIVVVKNVFYIFIFL